jgi:RNA polymerase sigma factor (sigma-70 family)
MTESETLTDLLRRLAISPVDENAWISLYRRLWPFVIAVMYRRLRGSQRAMAEDAAQEVFVRLLRSPPFQQIQDADAFRGYLWRIADNVAKSHRRKAWKDERGVQLLPEWRADDEGADLALEEKRFTLEETLHRAQKQLDPKEFELLQLVIEGWSLGEVAGILGLSYSNTGVRLHRLKRKLRNVPDMEKKK